MSTLEGDVAMVLDDSADRQASPRQHWLYRCADRSPFAYSHGQEFIRWGDHSRWALVCDDRLLSMRSGVCLAYRVGNVYYDASSDEPLYYVPSSFALPEPPSGERGVVWATLDASPHRTARRVAVENASLG